MKFHVLALATLFATAMAIPYAGSSDGSPGGAGGNGGNANYQACPNGLYSSAECCATDILGVADLDCITVPKTPTSGPDFKATCARDGKRARCCVLPVAGIDVLCQEAPGTA